MTSTTVPQLPQQYEPVWLDASVSPVAHATKLLLDGCDEGVLVVAPLDDLPGGHGGNLDLALTLHPEIPRDRYGELAFVAAVSLGQSFATAASPMITLQYGWPDRIFLNDLVAARVALHAPDPHRPLLVLSVSASIQTYQNSQDDAGCLRLIDPESEASASDLLGLFSRHFLHWINQWDETGFSSVHRAWEQRLDKAYGEPCTFTLDGTSTHGVIEGINDNGDLKLKSHDESIVTLDLNKQLGL